MLCVGTPCFDAPRREPWIRESSKNLGTRSVRALGSHAEHGNQMFAFCNLSSGCSFLREQFELVEPGPTGVKACLGKLMMAEEDILECDHGLFDQSQ